MSLIIPIIMGSNKDLGHAEKIHAFMKENFHNSNILLINRICSWKNKSGTSVTNRSQLTLTHYSNIFHRFIYFAS